jgi:hypothetical protein
MPLKSENKFRSAPKKIASCLNVHAKPNFAAEHFSFMSIYVEWSWVMFGSSISTSLIQKKILINKYI